MTIDNIFDYSGTAASNVDLEGTGISNSTYANEVDDLIRALMADIATGVVARGNDIASASTIDFDAASTPSLIHDITGTTTVTAVTLTSGQWRICRAVAAFQITASSSLIVNGSTSVNWNTAAGDILIFQGYGSSVVRVAAICGTQISTASTTEALTGTDTAKAVTPDALAALWEKGADVASASTVSLGEGGYFHITGTTTITDIDFATAKNGRFAWLVFDGILTLTHNATTLVLPGGANITTAAGDTCLVVQDSGDNVKVVAYIKASGGPVVASAVEAYTLLGTLTTTSGTTQPLTGIPSGYRELYIEVDGVSFTNGSLTLQLALSSTNGAAYGTAVSVSTSTVDPADTFNGALRVCGIWSTKTDGKSVLPAVSNSGLSTVAAGAKITTNTAAVVDAIRFSGGTFDAGTIRVYGVK